MTTAAALLLAAPAAADPFEVNSLADPGTGACDASECTLREALTAAQATLFGDTITFAPGVEGTIRLTAGQLTVVDRDRITIVGPGSDKLAISGDADADGVHDLPSDPGPADSRILELQSLDPANYRESFATISGLTFEGGTATGNGGAVLSSGLELILQDVSMVDNLATGDGGGLYDSALQLGWLDGRVSGNVAFGDGGGLAVVVDVNEDRGESVSRLAITGNESGGAGGGALLQGDVAILNSTLSGNNATDGGGAAVRDRGRIIQSTVSGNGASGRGGGVYVWDSGNGYTNPSVESSTIAANTAAGAGGGIFAESQDTSEPGELERPLMVGSTIVADNGAADGNDLTVGRADGLPVTYTGYSDVIEHGPMPAQAFPGAGPVYTGVDPLLGPLGDYGGPTETQVPAATSIALDATAYYDVLGVPATDQRGLPRNVDSVAGNITGAGDIGAVERQDPEAIGDDDIPPDTTITEHPPKLVRYSGSKRPVVRFRYAATDDRTAPNHLAFDCRLGRNRVPCHRSFRRRLGPGRHKFQVRAVDPAGNVDKHAAIYRFRIKKRPDRSASYEPG